MSILRFTLTSFLLLAAWNVQAADADVEQATDAQSTQEVAQPVVPGEQPSPPQQAPSAVTSPVAKKPLEEGEEAEPWDYSPYRVLVWLVSEDPTVTAATLEDSLRDYLDRDFAAVWRMELLDAPASIRTPAIRDLSGLSYDSITAADPVLAVKRDHKDAVRIRIAKNVGEFVTKVYCTPGRARTVKQRAAAAGDETIAGVANRLEIVDGDEVAVGALWANEETEGMMVSRGMALTLTEPAAKLITLPVSNLVGEVIDLYDKIFVVKISTSSMRSQIDVVELDTLMRHFGPVATVKSTNRSALPMDVGRGLTKAFAPVVRIDNAGQRNAVGLLRASGLIMDEDSPASVHPNDVLEPMTRKNDRNGNPILIGPIDWAYLNVTEPEVAVLRPVNGTGLKSGDKVMSIDDLRIENAQQVSSAVNSATSKMLPIEVFRGEDTKTVNVNRDKTPIPLQAQYLGFTARDQRAGVVVTKVIEDGPAETVLEVGDVILKVAGAEIIDHIDLGRLVVSSKQPVKLTIQRDEKEENVSIESTDKPSRDQKQIEMDFYAGRSGGLQGRKNKRTFRTALKSRPFLDETLVRLHLQREPDFPLIGYEIYQKELRSSKMTFIGRTDWNGRLLVERTKDPLRLFYVKNGGAVLARLPVVPGLYDRAVADLSGDDLRLQAEAYIRGVQNAIVDLVAIRELFKARIRMRLQKGQMEKAEELMQALRDQPSNEALASEMGKKQTVFLTLLGNRNANQRRKVDEMFTSTRELLGKHINPKLVRDLEADLVAVKAGKPLPNREKKEEEDEEEEKPANAEKKAPAPASE